MSKYIYSRVETLKRKYRSSDPFELLDALHAVTVFSDRYPKGGLRGYCMMVNRTRYVVINGKQPEEEQRVVAAHEAGHLILHGEQLKIGALRDMDIYNVTGKQEREANLFAADLLINDGDVLSLLDRDESDFISVARQLCVPAPFFAFKLYSMVERGYSMRVPVTLDSRCLK